ncbi:olfactory receptor 14I1-like [Tachyglossus aculeatus]|uniref:olfactory receptor 14I1-like n=1 Tax=Tachyglossus aculeatus TaxID=9261 RepID=UPI0018F347EE|nr:olfactory receptor 14I1-like [Tachyglossus aculeatus]
MLRTLCSKEDRLCYRHEFGTHSITGEVMFNITTGSEFLLLGFLEVWELQMFHSALFLLVYPVDLTENLFIVTVTARDKCLHISMYFLFSNQALIDLCLRFVTVPKSVISSLTNNRSISFLGCVLQFFSVISLASTEMILLIVVSHDCYVAICPPLLTVIWRLEVGKVGIVGTFLWECHGSGTMLRMLSSEGWTKAFSTCVLHHLNVAFFFSNSSFAYLKLLSDAFSLQDLLVCFLIYQTVSH